MTKRERIFLGLLGLLLLARPAGAQTALGKHPADKLLPAFLTQNANANTLALGLSNSTVADRPTATRTAGPPAPALAQTGPGNQHHHAMKSFAP